MAVIHEITQHHQNPLIQVFVGGKLFFLLCMQQTATNLSSTLHLLFSASSDHVAVFLPTYFFYTYRQVTGTNFGFSEDQRKKTSVQMPQSVTSSGESKSQSCSRTTMEFPALGSFYYQQQWSAVALGSFLSRSCCLETKSRKFRHQGELPRVTFKKSEQMES